MNSLQIQITELEDKIDNLRKLVEKIGEQVNILVKEKSATPSAYSLSSSYSRTNSLKQEQEDGFSLTNHKDIIMDDSSGHMTISALVCSRNRRGWCVLH